MINNLPNYINLLFGVTTLLTVWMLYKASHNSKTVLYVLLAWLCIQAFIGLSGFYLITDSIPPRFLLLVLLPLILIFSIFINKKGRVFIDGLDLKTLTILHIIRIPVEIVLFLLFVHKAVPQLMTFEGTNFDILAGFTSPLVYFFGFGKYQPNRIFLIIWNFICLGLLINIVVNAILSVPFPFQQFEFEQPNIAVLYFPYVWLPCCVVPLVLFSHLAAIRQLTKSTKKS